jgi:hypothetical protein
MHTYTLALLAALQAQAAGIPLTNGGASLAAIVSGQHDEYAASRVIGELRKYAPTDAAAETAKVLIYVGTLSSNSALARAAADLGWKADIEKLPPEGYLIRSGTHTGKSVIVLAGGDRTGAIYAASDLKNYYLHPIGNDVETGPLNYTEIPKMKYRWFWNWDVRTNWDLLDHDNVYTPTKDFPKTDSVRAWFKRPEAFVNNMKLVIDYMSEHKLNGLILWGFLRDNHGGVPAALEVCRYANERGVKIIPGAGIDRHYGGFYHEGNHEFNLETRAEQNPRLGSIDKNGKAEPRTLCLDLPENRAWVERGFRWLYATFPIGGVNVEFAEHSTCYNPECIDARKRQGGDETDFSKDLARIVPFVMKTIHDVAPGTWMSYVTYGGFTPAMREKPPLHVRLAPDYAICQWTLTNMLTDLVPARSRRSAKAQEWTPGLYNSPWPEGLRPPGANYIGYIHWNAFYTHNQKGFFVDAYREAARKAYRHGFQGIDTYGEESPEFPNVELSYLAFSEFTYNPEMSDAEFLAKRVKPLYGGEQAARLALEIARRVGPVRMGAAPADVSQLVELAYQGRRLAEPYAKARWDKMIQYVRDILPK